MAIEREQVVGLPGDKVLLVRKRLPEEVMGSEYSVARKLVGDGPRTDRCVELQHSTAGCDDSGEPSSRLIGLRPEPSKEAVSHRRKQTEKQIF